MDNSGGPNILHLYLTQPSGICEITEVIPRQTMTLKQYRMANDLPSLPAEYNYIIFKADFLSPIVNGTTEDSYYNKNDNGLFLTGKNARYTNGPGDTDIRLSKDIPLKFNYDIIFPNTALRSNFNSLSLIFNYNKI